MNTTSSTITAATTAANIINNNFEPIQLTTINNNNNNQNNNNNNEEEHPPMIGLPNLKVNFKIGTYLYIVYLYFDLWNIEVHMYILGCIFIWRQMFWGYFWPTYPNPMLYYISRKIRCSLTYLPTFPPKCIIMSNKTWLCISSFKNWKINTLSSQSIFCTQDLLLFNWAKLFQEKGMTGQQKIG